jgi:hypothetical protein
MTMTASKILYLGYCVWYSTGRIYAHKGYLSARCWIAETTRHHGIKFLERTELRMIGYSKYR